MDPASLTGPLAALAGSIVVIVALWRDHLRADADDRSQRDIAIAGWRDQTGATTRLADAIEAKARDDGARKRQNDRT